MTLIYTMKMTYQTKAHMGMLDVTDDFQVALKSAESDKGIKSGIITGFTTGGVAGITIMEYDPGLVEHDLKKALDVFSPYKDETGQLIHYKHHDSWNDDNGSGHIKAALLSPSVTIPFVDGKMTLGPWQNVLLVECDSRDRVREIVFQIIGE